MFNFIEYLKEVQLQEIEYEYGSIANFLNESKANVVNQEKFSKAQAAAKTSQDKVNAIAKRKITGTLSNYGRSFNDGGDFDHLHDNLQLHKERGEHLAHLKRLYNSDKGGYQKEVDGANKRLNGMVPFGENAKTGTMRHETVDGKEVLYSLGNKGVGGSVAKFHGDGEPKMHSTCVNSKQSCRGEGEFNVGATCLNKSGNAVFYSNRAGNTEKENYRTMKAPATTGEGHTYETTDDKGKTTTKNVAASPHLDYATLEYHQLLTAANKAHKASPKGDFDNRKLVSFRQNTQNEHSAMHYDQLVHHLPDHLKPHVATNNYSATPAKSEYDPNNPSHASTHDGVLNNTNFSLKGPEVVHDDRGTVLGTSRSGNLQDALKALNPEVKGGTVTRVAQNGYAVIGGHSGPATAGGAKTTGVLLRQPKGKDQKEFDLNDGKDHSHFEPFNIANKIKTARIHTEVPDITKFDYSKVKKEDIRADGSYDHPDGHGIEVHTDPNTGKTRHFAYQDFHVFTNTAKPDDKGKVNFKTLNDNVGSDERRPKEELGQVKRNKDGHPVGAIHLAAPTASTSVSNASGVHTTGNDTIIKPKVIKPKVVKGQTIPGQTIPGQTIIGDKKVVGDDKGLANDPFVFPIQHHVDGTRINLNHPTKTFEAEKAEKERKAPIVTLDYNQHPKTTAEKGEI